MTTGMTAVVVVLMVTVIVGMDYYFFRGDPGHRLIANVLTVTGFGLLYLLLKRAFF